MEELSANSVECADLRPDLCVDADDMTANLQRLKDNVWKSLNTIPTELQKNYNDMVAVVRRRIQKDLMDGWKKVETHFQVESAYLAVGTENELLRRSSDYQILLGKSSDRSGSCATKVLEVGSNGIPSASANKAKRPGKA